MAMHLSDLKRKPVTELMDMAREMGLDNVGRSRKQEVIAAIVRKQSKSGEDIYGEGTLEILQDGFGFLRSPDSSYLAGPDDIYVSPSQVRRFLYRHRKPNGRWAWEGLIISIMATLSNVFSTGAFRANKAKCCCLTSSMPASPLTFFKSVNKYIL